MECCNGVSGRNERHSNLSEWRDYGNKDVADMEETDIYIPNHVEQQLCNERVVGDTAGVSLAVECGTEQEHAAVNTLGSHVSEPAGDGGEPDDLECDHVDIPERGMHFPSYEELLDHLYKYGRQNGFRVVILSTKNHYKSGEVISRVLGCHKAGRPRHRVKDIERMQQTRKSGCQVRFNIARCRDTDGWKLNSINLTHNHPMEDPRLIPCQRPVTQVRRKMVNDGQASGEDVVDDVARLSGAVNCREEPAVDSEDEVCNPVEIPERGMQFPSYQELLDHLYKYGKQSGFAVVVLSLKKHFKSGEIIGRVLGCHRAGRPRHRVKDGQRRRQTWKSGCPVRFNVSRCQGTEGWKLNLVHLTHNHPMGNPRLFRSGRPLPPQVMRRMILNDIAGEPTLEEGDANKDIGYCGQASGLSSNELANDPEESTGQQVSHDRQDVQTVNICTEQQEHIAHHTSVSNVSEPSAENLETVYIHGEIPQRGMRFPSFNELFDYLRNYGKQIGFRVVMLSVKKHYKSGVVNSRVLGCYKGGRIRRSVKNPKRNRPTYKSECQVRFNVSLCRESGEWKLNLVNLTHNHPLFPGQSHFPSHKKRQKDSNSEQTSCKAIVPETVDVMNDETSFTAALPCFEVTQGADSTVRFEGLDPNFNQDPVLQEVWGQHGNVFEGSCSQTDHTIDVTMESLAKMITILQSSSGRLLHDSENHPLNASATLHDLEPLQLKLDSLVPLATKALEYQKWQGHDDVVAKTLADVGKAKVITEEMKTNVLIRMTELQKLLEGWNYADSELGKLKEKLEEQKSSVCVEMTNLEFHLDCNH